jgi:NAD-dependent SIR2 family protein deacetylase
VVVDEASMRATVGLPACPACGALARPNVLMFGDARWDEDRTADQFDRYRGWLRATRGARLAVIECGAGTAVPTVRLESERVAARHGAALVRVNVRDPQVPPGDHVGVPMGARDALAALDRLGI